MKKMTLLLVLMSVFILYGCQSDQGIDEVNVTAGNFVLPTVNDEDHRLDVEIGTEITLEVDILLENVSNKNYTISTSNSRAVVEDHTVIFNVDSDLGNVSIYLDFEDPNIGRLVYRFTTIEEKTDYGIDEEAIAMYETYLSNTNPVVTIEVEGFGVMKLELFYDVAPNSVRNFIQYVEDGFYDGSVFHRVIENFMIQGGGGQGTACPIEGEFSSNGHVNPLLHTRGVISMARTNLPNSATSQFFIMHKDSRHLDGSYAAFGALISGFEVLDEIATSQTGFQDRPLEEIVITKITIDLRGQSYGARTCYN